MGGLNIEGGLRSPPCAPCPVFSSNINHYQGAQHPLSSLRPTLSTAWQQVPCVTVHVSILLFRGPLFRPSPNVQPFFLRQPPQAHARRHHRLGPFPKSAQPPQCRHQKRQHEQHHTYRQPNRHARQRSPGRDRRRGPRRESQQGSPGHARQEASGPASGPRRSLARCEIQKGTENWGAKIPAATFCSPCFAAHATMLTRSHNLLVAPPPAGPGAG